MSSTHASASSALMVVPSRGDLPALLSNADGIAAAFLAGYKPVTSEAYARDLRVWGAFLARLAVDPLDARRVHLDAFLREAENAGVAASTLARRLSALAGFYAYALDEGAIERSPVARVRRPRVPDESPRLGADRDGLRGLLAVGASSSLRDHALVCLLALSGLRVSEATGANVADLGHERGHRTLALRRKGGKRQTVALAPRTAGALDALLDGRQDGPMFVADDGERLSRFAAHRVVRRLAQQAGIEHAVSPHSLRHGFVTAALDAGVSLRDVQDAAGHADPRTTRRYDRGRNSLERAATYTVATWLAA